MGKPVYALAIEDDNGNVRAYLEEKPVGDGRPSWYYIYNNRHEFLGAGTTLQGAIDMAKEKTGITVDEMPPVERSALRIVKGPKIKIVGFQGGGYYRHDTVYLGDKTLGTLYVKEQPARRRHDASTHVGGACVMGWHLDWMLRQYGYRLVG